MFAERGFNIIESDSAPRPHCVAEAGPEFHICVCMYICICVYICMYICMNIYFFHLHGAVSEYMKGVSFLSV